MRTGTKSLLFGVHQFIWHPITVHLAWRRLFGWPSLRETACIFIHDWGYWGCEEMEGVHSAKRVLVAAAIADLLFGRPYYDLILLQNRYFAKKLKRTPSKLYWAKRLSVAYDPQPFYLLRARLSGELIQARAQAARSHHLPLNNSDETWMAWVRSKLSREFESHEWHS